MSDIRTRPLDSEEIARIAQATHWVNDILERGFHSDIRLSGKREDIPTLHSLLSKGPYSSDVSAELIIFGTVFGEILANEVPLKWVVFNDKDGSDFALQYQDFSLFVFPCDMIIKRIENVERVDDINLELILQEIQEAMANDALNAAKRIT